MGKGIECDVLRIPARELRTSDRFWHMGQWFTVWTVEYLQELPATTLCNTSGQLLRVTGECANYQSTLILDSRLEIKAVMRDIGELD